MEHTTMKPAFRVTYEIITPESAEHGDAESRGYASPGGWRHDDPAEMSLREAIDITGTGLENCGRWFASIDSETDYRTGDETRYALHPPSNITRSSFRRLARVLGAR